MLTNFIKILEKAKREGYAVGHFNTTNLEETQAIIEAATESKSPVIIGTSAKSIEYAGIDNLADIVKNLATRALVPVVLHLDHGRDYELVKQAIKYGYTSVMYDGSKLPFEENLNITKKIAKLVHNRGMSIEAELGMLLESSSEINDEDYLTDPDQAKEFVRTTGVDALAVAVGTAHGLPIKNELINFDRIALISKSVDVPLVLHGSSNSSHEHLKKAIKSGISKINIDTELRQAFTAGVRDELKDNELYDIRKFMTEGKAQTKDKVKNLIKVFGSNGKA
jgi:fructose-bisphosphate aldolase class II